MPKCDKRLLCKTCLVTDHKELKKFCVPILTFFDERSSIAIIKDEEIVKFEKFLEKKALFQERLDRAYESKKTEIENDFTLLTDKILGYLEEARDKIISDKEKQYKTIQDGLTRCETMLEKTFFEPTDKISNLLKVSQYPEFQNEIQALVEAPNYTNSEGIIEFFHKLESRVKILEDNPHHNRMKLIESKLVQQVINWCDTLKNLDKEIQMNKEFSWDAKTVHLVRSAKSEAGPVLSCCSLSEKAFATGHGFPQNRILIWDEANMRVIKQLLGHEKSVTSLILLKEDLLISGSCDHTIKGWDLSNYQNTWTVKAHTNFIFSLAKYREDMFLSASHDKTIKIWRFPEKQPDRVLFGHTEAVWTVIVLQDKETICSGSSDGRIKLWEYDRGECKKTIKAHTDQINAITTYGEGFIVSGSDDCTIKVWNWKDGTLVSLINDMQTPIWTLLVKSESDDLIYAGDQLVINIANLEQKETINNLYGFEGFTKVLFELPSGFMLTGSYDGGVRLWNSIIL